MRGARTGFALAIGLAAGLTLLPAAGRAQDYPWCSNFADGAGTNCGWATHEQCEITVRGSGGYCSMNERYKAPSAGGPVAARRRSRHKHRAEN